MDPLTAIALAKVALDVIDKILYLKILDVESQPASVRAARSTLQWEDEQRWRALLAPMLAHFPLPPPVVVPPKITQARAAKRSGKPAKMSYEPPCPAR